MGDAITRRQLLERLALGAGAIVVASAKARAASYQVGASTNPDACEATLRAINYAGRWPAAKILGRTVLIKPNLVMPVSWQTGTTTHPEIVRAVVDRALGGGAARVKIVEGGRITTPGRGAANFSACGYDFFRDYHPRVELVDLSLEPTSLAPVPPVQILTPSAYGSIYLPTVLLEPGATFISVGKMKTHVECMASLTTKNLFGLPPVFPYAVPQREGWRPRYQLHDRGVHQAIVDLALARPIDYAILDGTIAMEGWGPVHGIPVEVGLVLAGDNHVAVDRVALDVMGIPQAEAQHLDYAYLKGLGPYTTSGAVAILGDEIRPRPPFRTPVTPPRIWHPVASPFTFSPRAGETTTIRFKLAEPAQVTAEIVAMSDVQPTIVPIRQLLDWSDVDAGVVSLIWDGRNDEGQLVDIPESPTFYAIRVSSRRSSRSQHSRSVGWVGVF